MNFWELQHENDTVEIERLRAELVRVKNDNDKEWFQIIESIFGFHPVSMTEALKEGLVRWQVEKDALKLACDMLYQDIGHGEYEVAPSPEFFRDKVRRAKLCLKSC